MSDASSGKIYSQITQKITKEFGKELNLLKIRDDSSKHSGHAAMKGLETKETHFHVTVVSEKFEGIRLVKRHQIIYDLLTDELKNGVHALQLITKTPKEYEELGDI